MKGGCTWSTVAAAADVLGAGVTLLGSCCGSKRSDTGPSSDPASAAGPAAAAAAAGDALKASATSVTPLALSAAAAACFAALVLNLASRYSNDS
jgi:hypothetical protein